ncbi:MAG: hypothetical protein IPM18_00250 [Phycisphaerales bacterium]|nr:hypothetical protein [Phycisphaerales bacterium]
MFRRTLVALAAMTFVSCALAAPLATSFTYQGVLSEGGMPANGLYDLQIQVYDAAVGGFLHSTSNHADVSVVDGRFTVEVNFGAGASPFNGDARWLQIGVRPAGSGGGYTALAPRQSVTAAPYALFALNSYWTRAGADRITNTQSQIVLINRNYLVGSEWFGVHAGATGTNYGGMYITTESNNAKPFYGYATGTQTAWTYLDGVTGKWHVHNSGDRLTVQSDGSVGIGTTSPAARLEVRTTSGNAVEGHTTAAFSYGVLGSGTSAGVRGESAASGGAGVRGVNNTTGGSGVRGDSSAQGGSGVSGYANDGTGIYGQSFNGYGVYGSNGGSNVSGYAGWFNGRTHINGTLSKSGGSFKIDHPLDPENMYLSHSFVESPDMMNIYNGTVLLDRNGEAVVVLPDWFEALNAEYRYQLTAIGAPAPNLYIAREIEGNSFAISGGQPGLKVSWQVTGVRRDPWAEHNRIQIEEPKRSDERGRFLFPEGYGYTAERSVAVPQAE